MIIYQNIVSITHLQGTFVKEILFELCFYECNYLQIGLIFVFCVF